MSDEPFPDEQLRQKYEWLKKEIQIGIDEADRGEVVDGPAYVDQLLRRLNSDIPITIQNQP